ncbi:MAG: tRNA 5-methoxyuridine(34)/uridine 5-oxyacetic acid(34) synthase CmoB [Deltaproteobacteria bacterium]|nr:tRNA 5-methoxyuridine(34)/uridine 5-oxyacetic acid(34) synthase CmoB [Deltaproteobacteria bacterium]
MIDYQRFQAFMQYMGVSWVDDSLIRNAVEKLSNPDNRDLLRWNGVLEQIGLFPQATIQMRNGQLCIDNDTMPLSESRAAELRSLLKTLCPWRKGPVTIHGIHIDTEWRSDFKWERVAPHISPLRGRVVLDVGCGNGYHCFRMACDGATAVLGVDPFMLSNMQFWAMTSLTEQNNVCVLPIGVDDVPMQECFHTVFSMGLLYHRKSPIDHLFQLKGVLKPGGEVVLETLVIEGADDEVLVPKDRYAMMRNVWFIPSIKSLEAWMTRVGFTHVRVVDVTQTTFEEQRKTEWMTFDSLADFLHPTNPNLTREGYPAPLRATFIASKPG